MDLVRKLSGSNSPTPPAQDTASMQMEFEVEEEQVLKGVALIYSDKLNDAEEYFDTLRAGHARFSLHHAEVATVVALMSYDEDDLAFATSLLQATEAFASEQEIKYRTHSNMKKVNETVNSMKSWALLKAAAVLEKSGFEKAAALSDKLKPKEEPPEVKEATTCEENNTNHKIRRIRLWCLYIQAECFLIIGLLNIVAGGESWSSMVKVGYNLKRAWLIYKHCKKKLHQLQQEWVAMGGSLQGELSGNLRVNYDSDDDDQEPITESSIASTSESRQRSADQEGWQTRQRRLSDPPMVEMGANAASGNLQRLEGSIKEDQELASLRIGIEFGMGAFNLIVSLIPAHYHKALELLGMPGDRGRAILLLHRVSATHHARAPLAAILLLHYHIVIMALLPRSRNHMESAVGLLDNMAPAWKGGCMFRILESRLARYEGNLQSSRNLLSDHPLDMTLRGYNLRLRNLMLDELGWCLMLQGEYEKAAQCFDSLLKETVWFKTFYGCLRSACLWESNDPNLQQEAVNVFRDVATSLGGKKSKFSPMELYATRISSDYITLGLAPLHPALELVAVYNGFQQMDQQRLEGLMAQIEAQIHQSTKRPSIFQAPLKVETAQPQIAAAASAQPTEKAMAADEAKQRGRQLSSSIQPKSPEHASSSTSFLQHKWIASSITTCRYLLALCMLNLGAPKAAEEHLRWVVATTDMPAGSKAALPPVLGNIAPYSCYELGSLLLDRDTSGEGLGLLEKSVTFPPHEFQTRLKFVVGERLKRFH